MKPAQKTPDLIVVQQKQHYRSNTIKLEHDLLDCWSSANMFTAIMQTSGVIYREIESRKTLKFVHADKKYFIKQHFGSGWIEIFKNLLFGRLPIIGAKNEYTALNKLNKLGINAPLIAGYGKHGCNPARQQSFLITHEVAQTISLDMLADQWCENQLPWTLKQYLIREIAYITATLHRNGINHRDLYACHFMIGDLESHSPEIILMDLHRAQIRKKVPLRWLIKDLASLYYSILSFKLTKRDLLRFIQHYSNQYWRTEITKNKSFWQTVCQRTRSFMKRHHKFFATPMKMA